MHLFGTVVTDMGLSSSNVLDLLWKLIRLTLLSSGHTWLKLLVGTEKTGIPTYVKKNIHSFAKLLNIQNRFHDKNATFRINIFIDNNQNTFCPILLHATI